jgi:hypothetical protein
VACRLADLLAGYLASVSEIGLKNDGEKIMGGASKRSQGVVLARKVPKESLALRREPCGSMSRDSGWPRKELLEHGRLLSG